MGECKSKAEAKAKAAASGGTGPSYSVTLQDPNDIKAKTTVGTIGASGGCSYGSASRSCTYVYKTNGACIDRMTAKVTYLTGSKTKCGTNEIKINNKGNILSLINI